MDGQEFTIGLSAIDTEHFSIPIARAAFITENRLPQTLAFCREQGVKLLIARCLVSELDAAQAMEQQGFLLMDTLMYYERKLPGSAPLPDPGPINIRPVLPEEATAVGRAAADAFRDFGGHYHSDKRLDRQRCDEAYVSWAERGCLSRQVADQTLVAEENGEIVGFASLRLNSPDEAEAVLFGVVPAAQRRGIYRALLIRGLEWALAQGTARALYSTQITNFAVQKVLTRVGCEPSHAYYTYHRWFDKI